TVEVGAVAATEVGQDDLPTLDPDETVMPAHRRQRQSQIAADRPTDEELRLIDSNLASRFWTGGLLDESHSQCHRTPPLLVVTGRTPWGALYFTEDSAPMPSFSPRPFGGGGWG